MKGLRSCGSTSDLLLLRREICGAPVSSCVFLTPLGVEKRGDGHQTWGFYIVLPAEHGHQLYQQYPATCV